MCDAGIASLPGRAGTVQEVFQDACENYYAAESLVAPMVLVGVDYWTRELPVWPLLETLSRDRAMAPAVHLVDSPEEAPSILATASVAGADPRRGRSEGGGQQVGEQRVLVGHVRVETRARNHEQTLWQSRIKKSVPDGFATMSTTWGRSITTRRSPAARMLYGERSPCATPCRASASIASRSWSK